MGDSLCSVEAPGEHRPELAWSVWTRERGRGTTKDEQRTRCGWGEEEQGVFDGTVSRVFAPSWFPATVDAASGRNALPAVSYRPDLLCSGVVFESIQNGPLRGLFLY